MSTEASGEEDESRAQKLPRRLEHMLDSGLERGMPTASDSEEPAL